MKAIIMAVGDAAPLYPMTLALPRHLLPVYDKPLIYYPLTVLMLGGIRDMIVVANPRDLPAFANLLGDGRQWGINVSYVEQPRPEGAVQAIALCERFIAGDACALISGETILSGHTLSEAMQSAFAANAGATIFGCDVRDADSYTTIAFDTRDRPSFVAPQSLRRKSNCAVVGLSVYDNKVVEIAKDLKASARAEVTIVDLANAYLQDSELTVRKLGRGLAWFDASSAGGLLEAANYVATLERQHGLKLASPEEVAVRQGYITPREFERLICDRYANNEYGRYLKSILAEF